MRSCLSGETLSLEPDLLLSSSDVLPSESTESRESRAIGGLPAPTGGTGGGGREGGSGGLKHYDEHTHTTCTHVLFTWLCGDDR